MTTRAGAHRAGAHRAARGPSRWRPLSAAAAVLMLAGAVVVGVRASAGTPDERARTTPAPTTSSSTSAPLAFGRVARPGVGPTAVRQAAAASPPTHLRIAAIGVDTSLTDLGLLKDGSLEAPVKWQQAGWYARGVRPGDVGPAVIAGHIDSRSGPAVFFRLHELRAGDQVQITRADGSTLTFVVDGSRSYAKKHFPTSAVYGPTPDPQLRLITCGGTFDRAARSYLDNLIVTAHLRAGG